MIPKNRIAETAITVKATKMAVATLVVLTAAFSALAPVSCGAPTTGSLLAANENNAGVDALKRKDFDEAVRHLRLAHSREPANATVTRNLVGALNARAKQATDAGRADDAERDYLEALALAPDDEQTIQHTAAFLNNRAVAFMRNHQLDRARVCFERTLKYLPRVTDLATSGQIKTNYSNFLAAEGDVFIRGQQVEQARVRYTEALTYNPANADALAALADLDYDSDEYAAALEGYRRAFNVVRPDQSELRSAIEERIDTLRKEMAIEADYVTIHDRAGRFRVYFPKDLPKGAVARILQTLDEAYAKIGRDFDFYPSRPLTAKVYSRAQLHAIQQIPAWVVGLFDGKIRLLDDRLLGDTTQLRRSIFHEYTHAILYLRGGDAVPSWMHEGLAQIETSDATITARDIRYLATRVRTRQAATLADLARPFERNETGDRMSLVYLQSKVLINFLLQRHGWEKIRQLVSETGRLGDFHAAFAATFGMTTAEMESEWKRWLLERDEKGEPTP